MARLFSLSSSARGRVSVTWRMLGFVPVRSWDWLFPSGTCKGCLQVRRWWAGPPVVTASEHIPSPCYPWMAVWSPAPGHQELAGGHTLLFCKDPWAGSQICGALQERLTVLTGQPPTPVHPSMLSGSSMPLSEVSQRTVTRMGEEYATLREPRPDQRKEEEIGELWGLSRGWTGVQRKQKTEEGI